MCNEEDDASKYTTYGLKVREAGGNSSVLFDLVFSRCLNFTDCLRLDICKIGGT
jgi:hypothetical protein